MKINIIFDNELKKIFELLNFNAKLVGGCVRDFILFNELVYDIDIATPFLPEETIKMLSKDFKIIPTGLKHGTITIVGKKKYEITTLRKDIETDGRNATVSFNASWQEDAKRRDFTINALYCDYEGNIEDYFDGLKDLQNRIVRFIGDPIMRIHEDYLRILRFFRFSMRFGSLDKQSLNACIDLKDNLKKISKERVTQEWFNIIKGKYFFEFLNEFLPILEVLNFDTKKFNNNANKLSALGLTCLFFSKNIFLCLSSNEKKYINNLIHLKLENQVDATILYNKFGEIFLYDKMILEEKFFELIKLEKMPINGDDLMQLGLHGKKIGEILEILEYKWAKEEGKISKEDLLKEVIFISGK